MHAQQRTVVVPALVGLLVGAAWWTTALASWSTTKWGMTIAELRALVREPITEIPADKKQEYPHAAFTHYMRDCVIETCRCEVFLAVDKQAGLQEVMLKLTDDQKHYACFLTWETALKKKYGSPTSTKHNKSVEMDFELQQREWITADTLIHLNWLNLGIEGRSHPTTNIQYRSRRSRAKDKL